VSSGTTDLDIQNANYETGNYGPLVPVQSTSADYEFFIQMNDDYVFVLGEQVGNFTKPGNLMTQLSWNSENGIITKDTSELLFNMTFNFCLDDSYVYVIESAFYVPNIYLQQFPYF